jgi:ElaB/YqjD/DUF883 family membrane-anchored ribosome-binding protein
MSMETQPPPMEETRSQVARERMLADLRAIAADAEALLQATADDAGDKAKETRARLAAALENAKATYQEFKAEQIDSAKAAISKADQTIRAHPYEAIGVAFGIGILLGALLRRK